VKFLIGEVRSISRNFYLSLERLFATLFGGLYCVFHLATYLNLIAHNGSVSFSTDRVGSHQVFQFDGAFVVIVAHRFFLRFEALSADRGDCLYASNSLGGRFARSLAPINAHDPIFLPVPNAYGANVVSPAFPLGHAIGDVVLIGNGFSRHAIFLDLLLRFIGDETKTTLTTYVIVK